MEMPMMEAGRMNSLLKGNIGLNYCMVVAIVMPNAYIDEMTTESK